MFANLRRWTPGTQTDLNVELIDRELKAARATKLFLKHMISCGKSVNKSKTEKVFKAFLEYYEERL